MARNIGNRPGPTPGPKGVVKQHHAAASGYELPTPTRVVDTFQKNGETGPVHVPGLAHTGKRR
jgi:hypothetical protein